MLRWVPTIMRVIRFVKKMRFVKWFKFAKLVPAIRAWRARQAMAVDIGSPLIAASAQSNWLEWFAAHAPRRNGAHADVAADAHKKSEFRAFVGFYIISESRCRV